MSNEDFSQKRSDLSETKQALIEKLLRGKVKSSADAQSIPRRADSDPTPLSFGQQRLWFLDQLVPENAFYTVPGLVRLKGLLNVSALEQSFNLIINRHDILRTSFFSTDNLPAQLIAPSLSFHLPLIDLSHFDHPLRHHLARSLATHLARQPFLLSLLPLFRAALIRLSDDDHLLLIVMHHIISDQWSLGILLREVALAYHALSSGTQPLLPLLPIQYADFAYWQQQSANGDAFSRQLAYWNHQLAGKLSLLSLPTDRPRPALPSFKGGSHPFTLSPNLTMKLKALSDTQGATLYMTLLAAFEVLLHRYSRQQEIVLGTAIAGRTRKEVEGLIGCFINTLVLRVHLTAEDDFRQVISKVKKVSVEAYANQEVPFEKVVEQLQPERELSRNPLFDVMFVYQNVPMGKWELGGVNIEQEDYHNATAKMDLVFTMMEQGAGLRGYIEYSTDLYEECTIKRMAGHFQRLLQSVAVEPDAQVGKLKMIDEAEREHLLTRSRARRDYKVEQCLHEMFERQAEMRPDAIAVVCGQQQLSYGELNRRANRLARRLRRSGVGPEVLVAVLMQRSVEMVVGLLAIVKAGGAYVPMDPSYPRQRLDYILEDAAAGVVLTRREVAGQVQGSQAEVICVEEPTAEAATEEAATEEAATEEAATKGDHQRVEGGAGAANAAYVIYTSGSTGRPKGVVVTHENVVRLMEATKERFSFNERDVWTMFHSYAFDFSVWEMWGALVSGAKLVVVSYEVSRSPEAFLDMVREEAVTVLNHTPSAFRQLMKEEETREAEGVKSLRVVIFGGEALEAGSLRGWVDRHGDERPEMVNMYGITETTVHVTYKRISRMEVEQSKGSIIGEGLSDLDVYVVDEEKEVVPVGVAGELYVGGGGLGRGYLKRAEQTAERFVPDELSGREGGRLYRTGDLGRYLADGSIEYLGRIDQQVKIRGFRIELGEIEAVLAQHPYVREAVVVAREDTSIEKRLVAYVVDQEKQPDTVMTLRGYLKDRLPIYMLPSAIVLLDELPLTTNGKINRAALPPPGDLRPELESAYVAPVSEAEQAIAAVWRELLEVDRVGMHDNFFDLGAHSLMMIQACKKLEERFDREIPMVDMLKFTTVSSMAKHLAEAQDDVPALQPDQEVIESRMESMMQRRQFRKQNRAARKIAPR